MRKPLVSIASLFVFVMTAGVAANASLITNGTFAGSPNSNGTYAVYSDPVYQGDFYDPTNISGWTFSDASGILKYPGFSQAYFPPTNPSGTSQFAFMQNVAGGNAISQTITDTVGAKYYLSFFATGNNNAASIPVVVTINSTQVDLIAAAYGWNKYGVTFVGTGSDDISFSSNGASNYDGFSGAAGLTEVSVVPTPEPSSMMLLGTGVLGLAAAGRRKLFNA